MAAVALVLLGLLAYGVALRTETVRMQQEAVAGQRELGQAQAKLQAMRQRADDNSDSTALKAEIDALKPQAEAVKQLLELIRNGSPGSPEGYAQHLSVLASVPEEGLWITGISIDKGGKLMTLSGRALRNESVLRYVKRLNKAFAPFGVQFNSMEMTPENLVRTGEPNKPPLTTVVFKLF